MKKNKEIINPLAVLLSAIILFSVIITSHASGYYVHDPMDNPKAAADIIVDPNAVYGYSPNPDSKRLGVFAQYDWSDEAFVEEMKHEREEYHESIKELYQIKDNMESEGKTVEEIARAVSTRRNEIRMEAYKDDPEGLEQLKQSNLATFGNENGGTPEFFYEKYGSWETVIEKAFSTNAGADAILGLYDKYYHTYIIEKTGNNDENADPDNDPASTPAATLNKTKVSLKAGKTVNLKVANGTVKTWTSFDKKIAKVSNGKVTALKKGSAKITALLKTGTKLTCKITVTTSPKLSKTSVAVKKGKTVKIRITGKAAGVNNVYTNTETAKFLSKKTAETLTVKGRKKGSTTLKIKVNGVTLKLKVKVK